MESDLIAASAAPAALALLAEDESHGYAIAQGVRAELGGGGEWADGMLYPVLHRLERLGCLESRWEVEEGGRRRKYYWITARGRARCRQRSMV